MLKNQFNVFASEGNIKVLDNLLATSNNLFHGSLKDNIVFLHFFKCGGTSIGQAIKSCYLDLDLIKHRNIFHLNGSAARNASQKIMEFSDFPFGASNNDYLGWKFREYLLLYYMSSNNIKYIAGHFSFSEIAYQCFADKYAFITILRDPVERFISSYFYRRYKELGSQKLEIDIQEYLESEKSLGGGALYVRHLAGFEEMPDYTTEAAITRAKDNLHKFKVVGCLEHQDSFLNQFEAQFGRRLKLRVLNKSPKSKTYQKSIITEKVKEQIRAICQPDWEIYQYALDNFVKPNK